MEVEKSSDSHVTSRTSQRTAAKDASPPKSTRTGSKKRTDKLRKSADRSPTKQLAVPQSPSRYRTRSTDHSAFSESDEVPVVATRSSSRKRAGLGNERSDATGTSTVRKTPSRNPRSAALSSGSDADAKDHSTVTKTSPRRRTRASESLASEQPVVTRSSSRHKTVVAVDVSAEAPDQPVVTRSSSRRRAAISASESAQKARADRAEDANSANVPSPAKQLKHNEVVAPSQVSQTSVTSQLSLTSVALPVVTRTSSRRREKATSRAEAVQVPVGDASARKRGKLSSANESSAFVEATSGSGDDDTGQHTKRSPFDDSIKLVEFPDTDMPCETPSAKVSRFC